jgi:hypothetical protein
LQTQHATAQRAIEVLEKVVGLEVLVKAQAIAPAEITPAAAPAELIEPEIAVPPPTEPAEPAAAAPPAQIPQPDSLTQMLSDWKMSVGGQWSSVREEWAADRERLASARDEWEGRVRAVESIGERFDVGLAGFASLQQQQQEERSSAGMNGDAVRGSSRFYRHGASGSGSGTGGLVTPPSPRSLSANSNRPWQQRRTGLRGRSSSRDEVRGGTDRARAGLEVLDQGAESESSTTSSTHPSIYTLPSRRPKRSRSRS